MGGKWEALDHHVLKTRLAAKSRKMSQSSSFWDGVTCVARGVKKIGNRWETSGKMLFLSSEIHRVQRKTLEPSQSPKKHKQLSDSEVPLVFDHPTLEVSAGANQIQG